MVLLVNKAFKPIISWIGSLRPPKRLYRYGTLGLGVYDDRTPKERFWDNLDAFLRDMAQRWEQRRVQSRHVWHTFFEPCTGTWITSAGDIARIERERGMVYMRPEEIHREAEKALKHREKKSYERTHKVIGDMYRELKAGKSYIRETNEQIRRGEKEVFKNAKAFN